MVAAAVACSPLPARAQRPDADLARRLEAQQSVLRQIEADLAAAQGDAERIRHTERGVAERLVDAMNRASMMEHALAEMARAESLLAHDMREADARRAMLRTETEARQKTMACRVRVLYIQGRRQPYQRALLASSLAHWLAARQYLATLNRRDAIDLELLRSDRTRLDSLAVLYRRQRETLDSLIVRKRQQREELVEAAAEARRLLRTVRRDRQLVERAAAELEAQRQASQAKIADYLAAQAQDQGPLVGGVSALSAINFLAEKGRLPWPVEGRIVSTFGRSRDTESRTWTRNRGIDISAPKGTEVLAVASGEVVMVDWFRGYGTFVIVSHGQNYYTLYAHLDLVAVRRNDKVHQGQVIGTSGDSGTLGDAKVHFELLAGHEALNPLEWLAPSSSGSS